MDSKKPNPVELVCTLTGWTQSELAKRLGVSVGAVTQWKARSTVPPEHVMHLSKASGVPPHLLNQYFPDITKN